MKWGFQCPAKPGRGVESLRSGLPAPDLCEEKFMSGQSEQSTLPALLWGGGGLRLLENHCYTVGNAGKKDVCSYQPDSAISGPTTNGTCWQ